MLQVLDFYFLFFSISITHIQEVCIDCVLKRCMLYFAEKKKNFIEITQNQESLHKMFDKNINDNEKFMT